MKKETKIENKKKIDFWENVFKVMFFGFMLIVCLIIVLPVDALDNNFILILWLITVIAFVSSYILFVVGMFYNALKFKRYGWAFLIFFLGIIFPIIFFFYELKKELGE